MRDWSCEKIWFCSSNSLKSCHNACVGKLFFRSKISHSALLFSYNITHRYNLVHWVCLGLRNVFSGWTWPFRLCDDEPLWKILISSFNQHWPINANFVYNKSFLWSPVFNFSGAFWMLTWKMDDQTDRHQDTRRLYIIWSLCILLSECFWPKMAMRT